MGSVTPALALPYPVGTDRVMDGDNAIQALAERIEAVLPRGVIGAWTGSTGIDVPTQAAVDVFGTRTRTLVQGRQYRISVSLTVVRATAGDLSRVALNVGGAEWHAVNLAHGVAGSGVPVSFVTFLNGTNGAYTFQVSALRAAGNGNISVMLSGAISSATLIIEDIGLVPPALRDVDRPDASLPDEDGEPPDRPDNELPEHAEEREDTP